MAKTKLAVIGCGGMTGNYLRRMDRLEDRLEVAAAVDTDRARARDLSDRLGGRPKVATDYHDVLDDVDAALLVLPHHLHAEVSLACLGAGKHVLVEKPMANTEADCLRMIETAERTGKVLMVGYLMRYHPLALEFKKAVDSGRWGKPFQISMWTEQTTNRGPDHWSSRAATLGGGQLFSHGCHYIDLLLWMLGRPLKGAHMGTNLGTPWMEREGTSNVVLSFENRTLGYHFGTWGARATRLHYSFHAHCEGGMIEMQLRPHKVLALVREARKDGGQVSAHDPQAPARAARRPRTEQREIVLYEEPSEATVKPTERELEHFLDCIETGQPPRTDGWSSLIGLQVIWKLYEAEERGTLADLSSVDMSRFR